MNRIWLACKILWNGHKVIENHIQPQPEIPKQPQVQLGNIDPACMIVFSIDKDNKPLLNFHFQYGREKDFINLIYLVNTGKLLPLILAYLKKAGVETGMVDYTDAIANELDRLYALTSYNGTKLGLDEEDPVVCPTAVFSGQKPEEKKEV